MRGKVRAEQIKAAVASYWRYQRQCPIVALEVDSQLGSWTGEPADVVVVNEHRYLIEIEVKISLADLKRDAKKRKHQRFRTGHPVTTYFYFALPKEIANQAKLICDDLFPYAGIMGANGQYDVEIYRPAKGLSVKKLDYPEVLRIIYGQSGTVCRLAAKVEELLTTQRNLSEQLQKYKDMEKLEAMVQAQRTSK